jgi:hypothetical protein
MWCDKSKDDDDDIFIPRINGKSTAFSKGKSMSDDFLKGNTLPLEGKK